MATYSAATGCRHCSEEVPDATSPKRVRLLGEDLIAFRDTDGVVALVGAFCPHPRADVLRPQRRVRLRCVYHGWSSIAPCVHRHPSEPPDSLFKTKVTIALPDVEGAT